MDTLRSFSMSTNEKTGVELGKTIYNKIKPLETSKNNIDRATENAKINLTEELGENVQNKLLSFSNFENEPEGVEEKSRLNNKPSISNNDEPKELNVSVPNTFSNTVICDTIAKFYCTCIYENLRHSDWQPCQSNKENNFGTASACSPASISFLANTKQNNSFSYKNIFLTVDSSIANEKHCFDCNNSKVIALKPASRHCLPLYNLGHSFFHNYQKMSDFMKLENSRNIVQDVLSSQISDCTSPESKIAVKDLIEKLLKIQSYINNDSYGKQQLFLTLQKMGTVTRECLNSNLDSGVKYTLNNSSESAFSSTNKLLVYPKISIDIKEKQKNSINQINNNISFQLFEECNKHVVIENDFSKSTEFFKSQKDEVPKHLASKTNLSLVGTSYTMNLSNQLHETLTYEQSAGNAQAFLKHKHLLSDRIIAESTAREKKSLNSLSRDIKVNETVIPAPQNEMNKPLIDSGYTQSNTFEATIDISKTYTALIGNITDQTFKIKPSAALKSLSHALSKRIPVTNSFPQKVSSESFIVDNSYDCTVQNCNLSLESQIVFQYPPLTGTIENIVEAKLFSNCNNSFPLFKGVDKCYHNSFFLSDVNENISCNPLKGKTRSVDINGRLAGEQQLFVTLSKPNTYVKSDPCKQVQKQLLERKSKSKFTHLSSQEIPIKPLLNTTEFNQEISNVNNLSRNEGALACLNKKKCDEFDRVEVSETLNCNSLLFQTEFSSSSSDELTNNTTASNKITLDKTIQLGGDTLDAEYFDDDIDKAIDKSMKKYASFTCDKGILATPDTSDKSSQTDKTCDERQISYKRGLNFEGEDFRPSKSKRTKTYHDNSKSSNFPSFERVRTSSLTELMSCGIKYDLNSSNSCINLNGSDKCINFKDDCTRTENNVLPIISKDSSLTINEDTKYGVNKDTVYGENSNLNDEFSLYDEEMDVEDELNWSKDSKEINDSDRDFSDHKVPVVEEVSRTELVKSK